MFRYTLYADNILNMLKLMCLDNSQLLLGTDEKGLLGQGQQPQQRVSQL